MVSLDGRACDGQPVMVQEWWSGTDEEIRLGLRPSIWKKFIRLATGEALNKMNRPVQCRPWVSSQRSSCRAQEGHCHPRVLGPYEENVKFWELRIVLHKAAYRVD